VSTLALPGCRRGSGLILALGREYRESSSVLTRFAFCSIVRRPDNGVPIGVLVPPEVTTITLKIMERLTSLGGDGSSVATLDCRKFMEVDAEVFNSRGNKHLSDRRGVEILVTKGRQMSTSEHSAVCVVDIHLVRSYSLIEFANDRCILQSFRD